MTARYVLVVSVILLAGGICEGDDKKDGKEDKDKLQGEWAVVSIGVSGMNTEDVKGLKLVVKGDEWTAPSGGMFKFKIDATRNPKHLDLMSEKGGKESTWAGIYKIEGDTLTFCRCKGAGGERPTEFKGGSATFLLVCKRTGK
jgi:uncharacterized protein (TIGR03067 family)